MTSGPTAGTTAAALHAAVSLFTRRAREQKGAEVSLPERSVLARLDRNGPDTTAGLARWADVTPQAMGVTVTGLVSRDLVQRTPDSSDRRRSILTVTAAGSEVLLAGRGALTDRIATTLEGHFDADDIAQLRTTAPLLQRLAELL